MPRALKRGKKCGACERRSPNTLLTAVSHSNHAEVALYIFCDSCAASRDRFLPEFRFFKFGIASIENDHESESVANVPSLRDLAMRSIVIGMANEAPGVDARSLKNQIPERTRSLLLQAYLDFIRLRQGRFRELLERNCWSDEDVSCLDLGSTNVQPNELKALQYFCKSIRLNKLGLSWNTLGVGGSVRLSSILWSDNIVEINLSWTKIKSEGAIALSKPLAASKRLQVLDLSGNAIKAAGAVSLARAVEANASLETLNLAFNSIGATGAGALARALLRNQVLRRLNLRGNCIGADGASAFAQVFRVNDALQDVNFMDNQMGPEGAANIARYFKGSIPQLIRAVYRPQES